MKLETENYLPGSQGNCASPSMADPELDDDDRWEGVNDTIDDPEEQRVIFCALDSYLQYAKVSHYNCTHVRRQAFYALPQAHWQMLAAPPFNYLETLDKVDDAIESNAELARLIVEHGLRNLSVGEEIPGRRGLSIPTAWAGCAKYQDVDKARSTIRQFFRDWSAEGAAERRACYGPVMRALEAEKQKHVRADGQRFKVLVPGAGLGRLVFDLFLQGYDVEGNEISYHQLLASSYILNHCERAGQHTIYPWIHTFSNHRTRQNHLRGYSIPDVHGATELAKAAGTEGSMSMCAADFLCLYSDEAHREKYDAVATVFFLDTAPNLLRYLETVFHCLRPGGVLVNVGPLLWHFEGHDLGWHDSEDAEGGVEKNTTGIADPGSFELADDEVMLVVEKAGFVIVTRETGVEAPYIHDKDSMLQTIYQASSWVARKPVTATGPSQHVDRPQVDETMSR
ncbi:hypothetical protein VTK73DRAFT_503 [Phialemonium thermophilum]|uniref:carnosine N-methyltransferase n=1 Tax=Phialemonium thermophilum TaxID=223376 RepID=A0ABR3Y3U5_9PEZI